MKRPKLAKNWSIVSVDEACCFSHLCATAVGDRKLIKTEKRSTLLRTVTQSVITMNTATVH